VQDDIHSISLCISYCQFEVMTLAVVRAEKVGDSIMLRLPQEVIEREVSVMATWSKWLCGDRVRAGSELRQGSGQ